MSKTKLEIINETVEYYSHPGRRAVNGDGCEYLTEDGRMCAVGRCLINPEEFRTSGEYGAWGITRLRNPPANALDLENVLMKEYRGHENRFWCDLQALHDTNDYWKNNELSHSGQNYVARMKKKWCSTKSCVS